jgi:predicted nucleic acid-binding protein
MPNAISNTSPLIYLYRIGVVEWLPRLFQECWIPSAVFDELKKGRRKGFDVPKLSDYMWVKRVDPRSMPSEWLALDLGAGELAAMALAMENPGRVVLLDDMLARRTAKAAGLSVWGTLKILLEAKSQGVTQQIAPLVDRLLDTGMWISAEIRQRILKLTGEPS